MANPIAVVEYYEQCYGYEEKRLFKVFRSREAFEEYCLENNIQIVKSSFGTKYYDDEYSYIVSMMEFTK